METSATRLSSRPNQLSDTLYQSTLETLDGKFRVKFLD